MIYLVTNKKRTSTSHKEKGDIQEFVHKDEFIAYMGSDNNGYLYVQVEDEMKKIIQLY